MGDLHGFENALQARLAVADREPSSTAEEIQRYMADFEPRQSRFEQLAVHLLRDVIRPRLSVLSRHLPNSSLSDNASHRRCSLWLGSTERFPVTAGVGFRIGHDNQILRVIIHFELDMIPSFVNYKAHDLLTLSIDEIDDQEVEAWVEQQLMGFVETFLQVDRGGPDLEEDIVSDPVCGMRMRRSEATKTMDYRGHQYFFCSQRCNDTFSEDPEQFIIFKPF